MNKKKFTVSETSEILTTMLGEDYLFYPCECKVDAFQDIQDFLFFRGYTFDDWRDDDAKRIPNDYVILDNKVPEGYYITISGIDYIMRHKFLFELTKSEKTCIEEYNC